MGCRISDPGVISLGLGLSKHKHLTDLNILDNHISDDGLDAFADLLERNSTIISLKFTPSAHVSSVKLRAVTKRNRKIQQDSGPRHLEKVVIRLFHQQYKLQQAQQSLKEHQKVNVELEESASKTEMEFNNNKQEILKRSKDISTTTGYVNTTISDLKQKREAMRADFERIQKEMEDGLEALKVKYEEVQLTSASLEKELELTLQAMNELKRGEEKRRQEYAKQIQTVREETEGFVNETMEITQKIKGIQAQMQEIQNSADQKLTNQSKQQQPANDNKKVSDGNKKIKGV
jgi:chromosome segregation ATPase